MSEHILKRGIVTINNEKIAPLTFGSEVIMSNGASLQQNIDDGTIGGGGIVSTDNFGTVQSGNVIFTIDDGTKTISYTEGSIYIKGKPFNISSNSTQATSITGDGGWNPYNPNYTSYFVYNTTSSSFEFRGGINSDIPVKEGDYLLFLLTNPTGGNVEINSFSYPANLITYKMQNCEKVVKRLTIIGDSLTAVGKWYEQFKGLKHNIKVLDWNIQAISGATLCQAGEGYASSALEGDTTIIFMGTNDCLRENAIGNPDTDTSSTDSFCGKFKHMIEILYAKDATMRILVVGGSPLNGYESGLGHPAKYRSDVANYDNALQTMCEYYGIPYLSLLKNIGINELNASTTQIDGCHYSPDMYKKLGTLIFEELYRII